MSEEPNAWVHLCDCCGDEMSMSSLVCGPCVRNGPLMEANGWTRRSVEEKSDKE